jgi:membrane peptidoglycan carboxypeptidase
MAGDFGEDEHTPVTIRAYVPWRLRLKNIFTRKRVAYALAGFMVASVLAAVPIARITSACSTEAIALADQHLTLAVAHPGWSFPARVVSAPVPQSASRELKLAAATALDYRPHCPPGPGELCAKTKEAVPREGNTFEPVTLGWLIGPDAELREHLPLEKAPKHLVDAILASEDRDFREHNGVNFSALVRALVSNVQEGGYAQGASTLTMQVVRNWNQQKERTLSRKLREAVMAMAVDAHLGKDGVLQAYLDTPYLGQRGGLSVCGFQAAARHYFGKDAASLDLAEAATLAAILPSPGKFGPDRSPALAKQKRDRVLETMKTMGYDVDAAVAAPMHTVPPAPLVEKFPAYLSLVRAALESTLPLDVVQGAGLEVTAAIDLYMQSETEKLLPEKTRYLATLVPKQGTHQLQSAGIVLDVESGRVRAVYGGEQASSTDFNRATQSLRQGGSAFKPVLYALAFSLLKADGKPRFTAASTEPNMPRVFKTPQGDWRPRNVAGEYSETASLAQAMAWSMNLVTAALLEDVGGPRALLNFAAKAGFDVTHFKEEMGVGLGQGEVTPVAMAELAAMIAGGGRRVRANAILSVKDFRGKERWPKVQDDVAVLTPEAAALTRELMRGVVDFGTGGAARGAVGAGYVGPMIGKTGTTDDEKDLWFLGATPRYASVVWMGYDRPARIGASASDFAAPLWGWWMNKLTKPDGPPPVFSTEPKLVRRAICSLTGKLGGPGCHAIPASFVPGTQPKLACTGDHAPDPIAEMLAGAREVNGKPVHESLWKRLARKMAEAAEGSH